MKPTLVFLVLLAGYTQGLIEDDFFPTPYYDVEKHIRANLDRITTNCHLEDDVIKVLIKSLIDLQVEINNCLAVPQYYCSKRDFEFRNENDVKNLEKSVDECNKKSIYDVLIGLLAIRKQDLNSCIEKVKQCSFHTPEKIEDNTYYLSKFTAYTDISMKYCKVIGGYLAEINSFKELKKLQEYLLSLKSNGAHIAGSDAAKEDTWVFPRTGKKMEVFDWYPGEPNNAGGDENCLALGIFNGRQMNDQTCNKVNYQFLCEVEP